MIPPDVSQIGSLLDVVSRSILAVKHLRSRWSRISAIISRLSVSVRELSDLPPPATSHPLALDLLRSLSDSLSRALELSTRCASTDGPPHGKLRAQSDLAATAVILDRLAADADLLLRSGALLDSPASTSPGGRDEARRIITRLQLGSELARDVALDSLLRLLDSDEKALVVAAQGVVPILTRLIGSSPRQEEKALAALASLAAVEGCRRALISDSPALIPRLVRTLDSGAAVHACAVLKALTGLKDHAVDFGSRGGIASLLRLCGSGTPTAQAAAADVLGNLALFPETHQNILDNNAMPCLINILSKGTAGAQANSLICLRNLVALADNTNLDLNLVILQEGALNSLKNQWESCKESRNLEAALGLLKNLASLQYLAELILAAGFAPLVAAALGDTSSGTRTEAANVVFLLGSMPRSTKEVRNAGAVYGLISMLDAKTAGEKVAATKALASLMHCNECRRMFLRDERGVMNAVQLLDPLMKDVEKKYVVALLDAVVQAKQCRKQMVIYGACGYLERLVELEVAGAKGLLDSLERGKLWGIFHTR